MSKVKEVNLTIAVYIARQPCGTKMDDFADRTAGVERSVICTNEYIGIAIFILAESLDLEIKGTVIDPKDKFENFSRIEICVEQTSVRRNKGSRKITKDI